MVKILQRNFADLLLFSWCYCFKGRIEELTFSRFDFNKDDGLILFADNVNLTTPGSEIGGYDSKTFFAQELLGSLFPCLSQLYMVR